MKTKEQYENLKRLHAVQGDLDYLLEVFGDHLAQRESYKKVDGIEAVHFYLVHKFNWAPTQVRAMTSDDLRFVLLEEMHGWTLPAVARV